METINYSNLMGGLISVEFPYILMILSGVFLAKNKIFHKEAAISFAKLMIEIFIPIYIFLNIARSTSVIIIQKNYLMIISVLIQMLFSGLISLIYIKITNMDIRYRYTWLILNCFVDQKEVHRLVINSFCYHLHKQTVNELDYCSNILKYNFVHVFFQCLFIWYGAFNLIRLDRNYFRNIKNIQTEIKEGVNSLDGKPQEQELHSIAATVVKANGKIESGKLNEIKAVLGEFKKDDEKEFKATQSFYSKVNPFYHEEKQKLWKEIVYVMLRPPIIAMFVGFIVGFITPIQTWMFDTTSAIYLFYDTFNSIGQSHIITGLLIIGTNLYIEDENSIRFSKKDLIAHFLLKCLILPFTGVIFSTIANIYIPDNKVLNFACFIQWIMPTSLDIMAIAQAKDINAKQVGICIAIQWLWLVVLSNFINLPPFLKAVGLIN